MHVTFMIIKVELETDDKSIEGAFCFLVSPVSTLTAC